MKTRSPLSGIWAKSAMRRQCGGSTICTGKQTYGRAGELTSVRLIQRACAKINYCIGILDKFGP
jgi:hypothetical protein